MRKGVAIEIRNLLQEIQKSGKSLVGEIHFERGTIRRPASNL